MLSAKIGVLRIDFFLKAKFLDLEHYEVQDHEVKHCEILSN